MTQKETNGRRFRPTKPAGQPEPMRYGPSTTGCPAVEQAIEGLYHGKSEEEFWTLISALNYALQMETQVLVPLEISAGTPDPPAPWAEHPMAGEKSGGLRFQHLRAENGKVWQPVFTCRQAVTAERRMMDCPMALIPLEKLIRSIVDEGKPDGMVLNPWGHSATLERSLLQGLLKASQGDSDDPGAEELAAAESAAGQNDWKTAVDRYRAAAEKGNGDALYALGLCRRDGHGLPQSDVLARQIFRTGAEAGHVLSLLQLADAYAEGGLGLSQDRGHALLLCHKAWQGAKAQPDISYCPELCLRLAEWEVQYSSRTEAGALVAEAVQGFSLRLREGDETAKQPLERAKVLRRELLEERRPLAAYQTEPDWETED